MSNKAKIFTFVFMVMIFFQNALGQTQKKALDIQNAQIESRKIRSDNQTLMKSYTGKGELRTAINNSAYKNTTVQEIIFSEDFESGQGNWQFLNNQNVWEIGTPEAGPGNAKSGSSCAATKLNDNYPDDVWDGLYSPTINLPQLTGMRDKLKLAFWHWYQIESDYDYGYIYITKDNGQTWDKLNVSFTGDSQGWVNSSIDISEYANESIIVDFQFSSDGSITYTGWYIDDITIQTEKSDDWITETGYDLNIYVGWNGNSDRFTNYTPPLDFSIFVDEDPLQFENFTLVLSAWDVDETGVGEVTGLPEVDQVYFNGHYIGKLTGDNEVWSISAFQIDPNWVVGGTPDNPGENKVEIYVDAQEYGTNYENWAVEIDYGILSNAQKGNNGVGFSTEYLDYGEDTNSNNLYDNLVVKVTVDVEGGNSGNYLMNGVLTTADGVQIVWDTESSYLYEGINNVYLYFDGETINNFRVNGPYYLTNTTVYNVGNPSINGWVVDAYTTNFYYYTQFESGSSYPIPIVIEKYPPEGGEASSDVTVSARFNIDMDENSINNTSFTVVGNEGNITGDVSYVSADKKAYFEPLANLIPNNVYTVTLNTQIKSTQDVYLPYPVIWSFSILKSSQTIIIFDANNDPIQNKEFNIYKVNENLTDIFKGTKTTNNEGEMILDPSWFTTGDQIKIDKIVHTEEAVKSNHEAVDDIMYQIKIDNGKFDEQGNLSFHALTEEEEQNIVLDHTTIMYNLVVSVEWDASQVYLDNLINAFRYSSNYLYDVSDGQIFINKTAIFDNKQFWDNCDIKIYTNNTQGPQANVSGINDNGYIFFPLKWFGNEDATRNGSFLEYPLNLVSSENYRTIIHEFGHFALKFYDEYINNKDDHVHPSYNFGFMDYQYDNDEPYASEMSSILRYLDDNLKNTYQFEERKKPCWEYFESNYESIINDIFIPIVKPTERPLNSRDYYQGPNNDISNLNYDVGFLMESIIINQNNNCFEYIIECKDIFGNPVPKATVWLERFGHPWLMKQGKTADNGKIRNLGVKNYDVLEVLGWVGIFPYKKVVVVTGGGVGLAKATQDHEVILEPIYGDYRMISNLNFKDQNSLELLLILNRQYQQLPHLRCIEPNGNTTEYTFEEGVNNSYNVSFGYAELYGNLIIEAVDDSLEQFPIIQDFSISTFTQSGTNIMYSRDGNFSAVVDSVSSKGISKMVVMPTNYKPLINGLEMEAEQGGICYSLSSFPNISSLDDSANITIKYADSDLQKRSESSLRIFKWSENKNKWNIVGGNVDTTRNEVTSQISSFGIYGAFTTSIVESPETGGKLDNKNIYFYPNPFNPDKETGTIRYSLSKPGNITIKIYDVANVLVRTLIKNASQNSEIELAEFWDGKNDNGDIVSNGVYFYVIESSSGERAVGKIAVLR